MRRFSRAAALLVVAMSGGAAYAKVTRLEITSRQAYGSFRAGDYVRLDGRVAGELAPDEGGIPDLDKATRNAAGRVAYGARVILFVPADPGSGNGALLVDVPNRGNAYANALYNSPRARPMPSGNLDAGTGFLEDRGYAVAEVYWEPGRGADLPAFSDADGRRFVESAGFAIVRDTADFLVHAAADASGTPMRASLGRTGARGTADLPLPPNVRMYDVAGASHVTVLKAESCRLPPGRLDWAPVARATLRRLGGAQRAAARHAADAAPACHGRSRRAPGPGGSAGRRHPSAAARCRRDPGWRRAPAGRRRSARRAWWPECVADDLHLLARRSLPTLRADAG